MKVVITGAFGNIGRSTIEELIRQGHEVRCFDLKTPGNEKAAQQYQGRIQAFWGDIRQYEDVAAAVAGQEAVIHLAFIIPSSMSHTGRSSEDHPDWAEAINVGGTRNVIAAAQAQPRPPRLVFASSMAVYGPSDGLPALKTAADSGQACDHYSAHKSACERLVLDSGLDRVILRLAAVPAVKVGLNPDLFNIPLHNPIEFVHTRDVGLAFANAASCDQAVGKVLLIGGGKDCQMLYRDFIATALEAFGPGMLPEAAFAAELGYYHWLDSSESQRLLQFQNHGLEDWITEVKKELGVWRHLARIFRPISRWYLLRQSPYYRQGAKDGQVHGRAVADD